MSETKEKRSKRYVGSLSSESLAQSAASRYPLLIGLPDFGLVYHAKSAIFLQHELHACISIGYCAKNQYVLNPMVALRCIFEEGQLDSQAAFA